MSDETLRALERQARTGDPVARAEWLRERVRAGRLAPERLDLAARAGDAAARAASPWAGPLLDARGLHAALAAAGPLAVARAALGAALAPRNLTALARYQARIYGKLLAAALRAVERPGDDEARERARALAAGVDSPVTWGRWQSSQEGLLALGAARCAGTSDTGAALRELLGALHGAIDPRTIEGHPDPHAAMWQPLGFGDEADVLHGLDARSDLLEGLRAGLAGWATDEPPPHEASGIEAALAALRGR